jgi:hypothetical protein
MRTFALVMACLAALACLTPSDPAEADGARAHQRAAFACRPPPWFRGLQDVAPFVCGTWWWWPRYYNEEFGVRHRGRHRDP